MTKALKAMLGLRRSPESPGFSHTLNVEKNKEIESGVARLDPRIELNALVATQCNGEGCRPPRVGLINHPRVTSSKVITEEELNYLTAHHGLLNQSFQEMDWDQSNVVRIKWSDIVEDFYHQAHFVFGYVDKKAFFDWKCSDLEAVQAPNDHSSRMEFDRLKNQRKRSRMVEGLKEKWYSFLLMDAMRFITEGEAFGFPQEFRTTTLNSKYFNGISSFNVPYDGAKPFFRQDSTVFVAPLKYASYNEANELSPAIMRRKITKSLKESLKEIARNAKSVIDQAPEDREKRIEYLDKLQDDIDAKNAYLCCPLTDRLKERSFNQHMALQISIWNVYVKHVKKLMLIRQADGLPLWDTWPSVELDMSDEVGLEFSSFARFRDSQVWQTRLQQNFGTGLNHAVMFEKRDPYSLKKNCSREFMSLSIDQSDRWLQKLLHLSGYKVSPSPKEGDSATEQDTITLEHDGSAPYQLSADIRLVVLFTLSHIVNAFPKQLSEMTVTQKESLRDGTPLGNATVLIPQPLQIATHYNWDIQEILRTHKDNRLKELVPLGDWTPPCRIMNLHSTPDLPNTKVLVHEQPSKTNVAAVNTKEKTPGVSSAGPPNASLGSKESHPMSGDGGASDRTKSDSSEVATLDFISLLHSENKFNKPQEAIMTAFNLTKGESNGFSKLLLEYLRTLRDNVTGKVCFSNKSAGLIEGIRHVLSRMPILPDLGPCLGYISFAARELPSKLIFQSVKQSRRKVVEKSLQAADASTPPVSSLSTSSAAKAKSRDVLDDKPAPSVRRTKIHSGDEDLKTVSTEPVLVMNPEMYKTVVKGESAYAKQLMRKYDAVYSTISRLRKSNLLGPKTVSEDDLEGVQGNGVKKRGREELQTPRQALIMKELTEMFRKNNISLEEALSPYKKIDAHIDLGLGSSNSLPNFSWSANGFVKHSHDNSQRNESEAPKHQTNEIRERMNVEAEVGAKSTVRGDERGTSATIITGKDENDVTERDDASSEEGGYSWKAKTSVKTPKDLPRAYNWYSFHYLSLGEKKQFIQEHVYRRKQGLRHGRVRNLMNLDAYKRFINDRGLYILPFNANPRFDYAFAITLPHFVLEYKAPEVLAKHVNDSESMKNLGDNIFRGIVTNLELHKVYPVPHGERSPELGGEGPYKILESCLAATMARLRKQLNQYEASIQEEYSKLPVGRSNSYLERLQGIIDNDMDRKGEHLKQRTERYDGIRSNDVRAAEAAGLAQAMKEMTNEEDDETGDNLRRGTRNRMSNRLVSTYFRPPIVHGPGAPRVYYTKNGKDYTHTQMGTQLQNDVLEWSPNFPPNRTGRDRLWPPLFRPASFMTKYLHSIFCESIILEEVMPQSEASDNPTGENMKNSQLAMMKALGKDGFLVDRGNKLRLALEVMIVHTHYALFRHPLSLDSPVDLLREFDRFAAERDRLWVLRARSFRFYQSRGFEEGMEFLPKRKDWELYLWTEILEDLPNLLDFYNCLLFARDFILPESANVHRALYITSMVLGGDVKKWEGSYREATSVQCVIRQMIVWRLFNRSIHEWTNWIMCDDDPISLQVLKNLNLSSFVDRDNNFFASEESDDEYIDGDFALSSEDIALNDQNPLEYSLTYACKSPRAMYWSKDLPLSYANAISNEDEMKVKHPSAEENTKIKEDIMKHGTQLLRLDREKFKDAKASPKHNERSANSLSILRYVFKNNPRVTHVFANIPWTSVIRYFYTAFTTYTEQKTRQVLERGKAVVPDLYVNSSGFYIMATSGSSSVISTPAVHFMKARILILDAMIALIRGTLPREAGHGRFDHHREFQVAVWAAATGKFIKKEAKHVKAKESLIFQRSLTNSKLVELGIKMPRKKPLQTKKLRTETVHYRKWYGHEMPPNAPLRYHSRQQGVVFVRRTSGHEDPSETEVEDEISPTDVVEVGKCRVEVDYIGVPWKDFQYLQQPPSMGNHIKNRNKSIDPDSVEARKIREAFHSIERELADFAIKSPHQDIELIVDLRRGKINMPAFINLAINRLLLSTDAAIIDRRALDEDGNYQISLATRRSKQRAIVQKERASEERKRKAAAQAKGDLYKRVYTKKEFRDSERKSVNRDPNAPMWMMRRKGTRGSSKSNPYGEMINSILPHHPDGELDDDDKRAEAMRLRGTSRGTMLTKKALGFVSSEREQTRVGDDFQADVPSSTAAGSTGGVAGGLLPDPAGPGDTVATISTLVSSETHFQDPTAADQADKSIFRYNIVYNEPNDSDFDYDEEEGNQKPWSKVKRAMNFRKSALAAKRRAAKEAGLVPDEGSSADESNSGEAKKTVSSAEEVAQKELVKKETTKPIKSLDNINHLLLQGLGAMPMDTD